jgi:predicted metal-dependent phosphoesterase TrpH
MTNERWNVDLHSHTLWSKDCVMRFETVIQLCRARGIDRIGITDHNTAEGALQMQRLAPDLVIVGEEIMTTKGEILAYFVKQSVPAGLSPQETINRLRDQGAAISVAHPFDRLRKGAWELDDLLAIKDQVDAIEVFNARCLFMEDNHKAVEFAAQYKVKGTAGSDAHSRSEYGRGMVQVPPFHDAASFALALEQAEYVRSRSPLFVHGMSTTAKWSKKLGLRQRQWEGG